MRQMGRGSPLCAGPCLPEQHVPQEDQSQAMSVPDIPAVKQGCLEGLRQHLVKIQPAQG